MFENPEKNQTPAFTEEELKIISIIRFAQTAQSIYELRESMESLKKIIPPSVQMNDFDIETIGNKEIPLYNALIEISQEEKPTDSQKNTLNLILKEYVADDKHNKDFATFVRVIIEAYLKDVMSKVEDEKDAVWVMKSDVQLEDMFSDEEVQSFQEEIRGLIAKMKDGQVAPNGDLMIEGFDPVYLNKVDLYMYDMWKGYNNNKQKIPQELAHRMARQYRERALASTSSESRITKKHFAGFIANKINGIMDI